MNVNEARILSRENAERIQKTDELYQEILGKIKSSAEQGEYTVPVQLEDNETENFKKYLLWLREKGFKVEEFSDLTGMLISWT